TVSNEPKNKRWLGIYELDGDNLRLCLPEIEPFDRRPTEFKAEKGSNLKVLKLKRNGAAAPAMATYPVADLVVPINGLDNTSPKHEEGKTKEDWLIKKIMQTVSPASWQESGGIGTIRYDPRGMTLVVNNTPRVQAR